MTKTTASAKTAIACALACALTIGSACAPALAATQTFDDTPIVDETCHTTCISEGDAVWSARDCLGIPAEDVRDVNVDFVWYADTSCWRVDIATWTDDVVHHVILDAATGCILDSWVGR